MGKGRDLGAITILQFFSKLSQGTAQMTTSRQALRLGLRLGLTRLLGFYYAHIGYYLGQLHYYHASYAQLALMLAGAICDGTGVLPGAAVPAAALFNGLYGALSVLFFAFSILPLTLALLVHDGPRTAILKPLAQLARLSPLFFILQSRAIAHYFSMEFAVGGASYIPTGRGLAISHQKFSELYASFAASSIYPGIELLLLLVLPKFICPSLTLTYWAVAFAGLTPLALLLGPAIFNPEAFVLQKVKEDFVDWCQWLGRREKKDKYNAVNSWSDFHALKQEDKARVRSHALLLPSKEMLFGLPLLLVAYETMQPHGWGALHFALLGLPIAPFAATLIVLLGAAAAARLPFVKSAKAEDGRSSLKLLLMSSSGFWIIFSLSLCCVGIFTAEIVVICSSYTTNLGLKLPFAVWATLLCARYFSWRVACNILLYLCQAGSARAFATGSNKGEKEWTRVGTFVAQTLACTVAALALLGDAILGLLLQLPVLLIACIPGVARLHHFSLLGLTQSKMANLSKMTNDPALLARNAPALLPYASHFDVQQGGSDIAVERMGASLFEGHSSGGVELSSSKPEAISYTKRKTSSVI